MTVLQRPGRGGRATSALVGALALLVVAGHFGAWWEPLDSVGHFRAHLAVLLVALAAAALALRRWTVAAGALATAALGFATTLPFLLPHDGEEAAADRPSYTLLQMNLRYDAQNRTPALRRIADARADIVTLQEVTPAWREALAALAGAYPFQAYCGLENRDGGAILSRRPFVADPATERCDEELGLIVRSVDLNGTPFGVASIHLEWPWPHPQWWQIRRLAERLPAFEGPSLLAGDFNATPWSAALATAAAARDWTPVHGIGPTWLAFALWHLPIRWFGLPIDNVLVSRDVAVTGARTLAPTASDHLPILLRLALAPAVPDPPVSVASRRLDH